MQTPAEKKPFAWEPLTPRGVARFAEAKLGRLWLVQAVVAAVSAIIIVWVLYRMCVPTIPNAIARLPAEGAIRHGVLNWQGEPVARLADGHWLALAVDLDHTGSIRSPAQFQIEFGRRNVQVLSLFGYWQRAYPQGWIIAFNRGELEPSWGAWLVPLLALTWLGTVAGLMLSWMALATLYAGPVWVLGFYANRALTLRGSWKLAGAGQMPGALVMGAALALYGLAALDLVQFLVAAGIHLLVTWVYLAIATLAAPVHPDAAREKRNPFRARPSPK